MKALLVSAVLLAASAAPAAAQPSPGCFFVRDIGGRSVTAPNTLVFKVMDRSHITAIAYYRVTVDDSCPVIVGSNARSGEAGLFRITSWQTAPGRSEQICGKDDVKISAHAICTIHAFDKLTKAEVSAIPRRLKP